MALEEATEAEIRTWVGTAAETSDLAARYERLRSVHAVALEVLRLRLADVLANPATFSIDGDYSQSWGENIRTLRSQVAQLELLVAAGSTAVAGTVTTGQLTRCDRGR